VDFVEHNNEFRIKRIVTDRAKRKFVPFQIRCSVPGKLLCRTRTPWFGIKYGVNLYRGCQHQCIYCDSRSECYQIENFNTDMLVKANAIDLLRKELASKRVKGTIGTGSMNDPYMVSFQYLGVSF